MRKEARVEQREKEKEKDDVTLFLLSMAPAIKRLQSWLKFKMQSLLHEAEFGPAYGHAQQHQGYQDYTCL